MKEEKYEVKELEGDALKRVRRFNPHIPTNKSIFGIWDKIKNCYIAGSSTSPLGYYWEVNRAWAEHACKRLIERENLAEEGK